MDRETSPPIDVMCDVAHDCENVGPMGFRQLRKQKILGILVLTILVRQLKSSNSISSMTKK